MAFPNDSELKSLYTDRGFTAEEIACLFEVKAGTVYYHLKKLGITRSRKAALAGRRPHNYRGWHVDGSGYISVKVDDDSPFVAMRSKNGYVREHRLVVAKRLGRPLEVWEIVHHRDHQKWNNSDENLEFITKPLEHVSETLLWREVQRLRDENARLKKKIDELTGGGGL